MTHSFKYYESALAGKPVQIHEDQPQPGYYKLRKDKNGAYLPVAIWVNKSGALMCRVGPKIEDAFKVWTWCADKPVAKADAKIAFETGSWPGDVDVPAAIGDNSGDLSLMEEAVDYMATCHEFQIEVEKVDPDKVIADRAANYATHLGNLTSKLDAERKEKIAPHLEAQRAINSEYNPVIDDLKTAVKNLKAITAKFLIAEQKRLAELQKASEAEVVVPQVKAGGQRGKRVSLRTVVDFLAKDRSAILQWALENRRGEMETYALQLAEKAAKGGDKIPGLEQVERKVAV